MSDWLAAGGTARRLVELIDATPEYTPTAPADGRQAGPTAPDGDAGGPDVVSYQPFPVNMLPEPVRSFVADGAEAIRCDPSYVALPFLTALAAAIGTTRQLKVKRSWNVPAILWVAIIGESGTVKTPAFKLAMRAIRERQRTAIERHTEALRQHEDAILRYDKELAEWKKKKESNTDPPSSPNPCKPNDSS